MNSLFRKAAYSLVALSAMGLLASCAEPIPTSRRPDDTGVIGRYNIKHGKKDPECSIQFNRNGSFDADFNGDGEIETRGKFEVTRNRISLVNTDAVVCKGLRGVYIYELDGVDMRFTEVADECGIRKSLFTKKWLLQ